MSSRGIPAEASDFGRRRRVVVDNSSLHPPDDGNATWNVYGTCIVYTAPPPSPPAAVARPSR